MKIRIDMLVMWFKNIRKYYTDTHINVVFIYIHSTAAPGTNVERSPLK